MVNVSLIKMTVLAIEDFGLVTGEHGPEPPRKHGGLRLGAGRPRKAKRPQVPHRSREPFEKLLPVHVTMRMADTVYNLRSQRSFAVLRRAIRRARNRFGVRILHFCVQGNHIHLVVEAPNRARLDQAMKGLAVRIGLGMNKMMKRRGKVIDSRYHTSLLRTQRAVKNAVKYVRDNFRKHKMAGSDAKVDPFSSFAKTIELPKPRSRLFDTS